MRFAMSLVLLPALLFTASCSGPPTPPQAGTRAITIVEAPDDWGPITVTPSGGGGPVTLNQQGVSVEGAGSSSPK